MTSYIDQEKIFRDIPYIKLVKYGLDNNLITTRTKINDKGLSEVAYKVIKKFLDNKMLNCTLPGSIVKQRGDNAFIYYPIDSTSIYDQSWRSCGVRTFTNFKNIILNSRMEDLHPNAAGWKREYNSIKAEYERLNSSYWRDFDTYIMILPIPDSYNQNLDNYIQYIHYYERIIEFINRIYNTFGEIDE